MNKKQPAKLTKNTQNANYNEPHTLVYTEIIENNGVHSDVMEENIIYNVPTSYIKNNDEIANALTATQPIAAAPLSHPSTPISNNTISPKNSSLPLVANSVALSHNTSSSNAINQHSTSAKSPKVMQLYSVCIGTADTLAEAQYKACALQMRCRLFMKSIKFRIVQSYNSANIIHYRVLVGPFSDPKAAKIFLQQFKRMR